MEESAYMFPTSVKEVQALGWDYIDIILFTGDAFVDHPSFGTAAIARWLQKWGYRIAVVPQPNWRDDLRDFRKLGAPRLYFGLNSGAMDSMVNHYTASKRLRHDDAYTPEGKAGARPDYAVTVYTQILKKLYPDVPVVIGGIEASLRRLTHYDYWKDCLMPSVVVTSGADYLCYGMGERPMLELTRGIEKGWPRHRMQQIPQIAFYVNGKVPAGTPAEISGHPRPDKREGPVGKADGRGRSEAEAVSGGIAPPGQVLFIPTGIPKVKGFSVREFVRTGCYRESDWAGRLRPRAETRLEESLKLLGLSHLADRDIATLSDGEFQKACIAVGLTRRAGLLLLDEPTAFLDVENRLMVLRSLQEAASETGTAVIFSSHDLHDALQVARRVLAITPDGRLLESGPENREAVLARAFPHAGW